MAWHQEKPFLSAVDAQGLETDRRWIRAGVDPAERGAGWGEFRGIWSAPKTPDGLLVLDDMLFADAQVAILELGVRIPRDLQLVVQTSRDASPPIRLPATLLEIDPAELAAGHVATIMRLLRGEKPRPGMRRISFRERPAEADHGDGAKDAGEASAKKLEAVETE